MRVCSINWSWEQVQIVTEKGTYNCPIKERDDDFYFRFKNQWHPVSKYAAEDLDADIKEHKNGVCKKRNSISQSEFEAICNQVLMKHPRIIKYGFKKLGIVYFSYPSHSGKSQNGTTLFFGEKGYITYQDWLYQAGSNEGFFIGHEISRKIHSALFD